MSSNNNAGVFIAIAAVVVMMLLAVGCVLAAAGWLFFAAGSPQIGPATPQAMPVAPTPQGLPIEIAYPGAGNDQLHEAVEAALRTTDASALPDGCVVVSRDGTSTVYLNLPSSGAIDSLLEARQQIADQMQAHLPAEATLRIGPRIPQPLHLDAWRAETQTGVEVQIMQDRATALGIDAATIVEAVRAAGLTSERDAESLAQLPIETADGTLVPLETVAEITLETKPAVMISEW